MESKEKVEEKLKEELRKCLEVKELEEFPITINVQRDKLPEIERWRNDE